MFAPGKQIHCPNQLAFRKAATDAQHSLDWLGELSQWSSGHYECSESIASLSLLILFWHYLSDGGPLRRILSDPSSNTRCCRNWCRFPCGRYSITIATGSLCRMTPNICAMLVSLTRLSCLTASSNALLHRQQRSQSHRNCWDGRP